MYGVLHDMIFFPGTDLPEIRAMIAADPESLKQREESFGWLPLHIACCRGRELHIDLFRLLVESYPEAAITRDNRGQTPLHIAVNSDPTEELTALLASFSPSALQAPDQNGNNPLHLACMQQSLSTEIISHFVSHCENLAILQQNQTGYNPIHCCCEALRFDVAEMLASRCPVALHQLSHEQYTPLHLACQHGAPLSLIQTFIREYPEAMLKEAPDHCGVPCLPIHFSLHLQEGCSLEIVEYLTLKLLELDRVTCENAKLLHHAWRSFMCGCHSQEERHSAAIARFMIKKFPDQITSYSDEHSAPIHDACRRAHDAVLMECIKLLVEYRPECLEMPTNEGLLPIHIACDTGNKQLIRYLLQMNPSTLQRQDANGQLPLHFLARLGKAHVDVIGDMLKVFPSALSTVGPEGKSPLHILVENDSLDGPSSKLLLQLNRDAVVVADGRGRLPTSLAARVDWIFAFIRDNPIDNLSFVFQGATQLNYTTQTCTRGKRKLDSSTAKRTHAPFSARFLS